ncbi:MAG TPA: methyltransferase domain-containing protein [Solirubrobacteraceae bacterium]|nr:methyltransferase domain-containing protein [Solirubrobacteraceae bacterium]
MSLHPLAANFAGVADAYERGRPDYPPEVADALRAELSLRTGAPVLDLGAGTGKLTRALVAAGLDVVAVEPQEPMRAILAATVGAGRVRAGTAEAIPLEDAAVSAVTVADAFHWFDQERALAEIRRVLRPGGGLAVLSTLPDFSGASWAHELGQLVSASRPEHPFHDGPPWGDALRAAGGWAEPREVRVTVRAPARVERLTDWIASFSWIAAMPQAQRDGVLAQARGLIDAGNTPDELPVHFVVGIARLA